MLTTIKKFHFEATKEDEERVHRMNIDDIPKTSPSKPTLVINDLEFVCMLLLVNSPRPMKNLVELLKSRNQIVDDVGNMFEKVLSNRTKLESVNSMISLTDEGIAMGYYALRKLEIVGWLK